MSPSVLQRPSRHGIIACYVYPGRVAILLSFLCADRSTYTLRSLVLVGSTVVGIF